MSNSHLSDRINAMNTKPAKIQPQDKFVVRFPDGLRDRVADEAKASGRSMNAEIVHRLELSFAQGAAVAQYRGAAEQGLDLAKQLAETVKGLQQQLKERDKQRDDATQKMTAFMESMQGTLNELQKAVSKPAKGK